MTEIIRKITVDLLRRSSTRITFATQNDLKSRRLSIHLTNGGKPYYVSSDLQAVVNILRSDGQSAAFLAQVCDDGSVEYTIDGWALAIAGEAKCTISLFGTDGEKLTSSPFCLDVIEALYAGNDIMEDSNYSLLTDLMSEVAEIQIEENVRLSSEADRVKAEGSRVSAENSRALAEERRSSDHDNAMRKINVAVDKAEKAVECVDSAVSSFDGRITYAEKRITNLEQGITPSPFETDDAKSYIKDVPYDALPYAQINEIGGMTRVITCNNLLPFPYYDGDGRETLLALFNDDQSVSFEGNLGHYFNYCLCHRLRLPSNIYYFCAHCENNTSASTFYSVENEANQVVSSGEISMGKEVAITIEEGQLLTIGIIEYDGLFNGVTVSPMLSVRSGLAYEPYVVPDMVSSPVSRIDSLSADARVISTLLIPDEVRALDGYGEGVSDVCYNKIVWCDDGCQKYVQVCAKRAYRAGDESLEGVVTDGVSKTVYTLPSAIETDISDIISDDNLIAVAGGGSLVFVNDNAAHAPSNVTYQLPYVVSPLTRIYTNVGALVGDWNSNENGTAPALSVDGDIAYQTFTMKAGQISNYHLQAIAQAKESYESAKPTPKYMVAKVRARADAKGIILKFEGTAGRADFEYRGSDFTCGKWITLVFDTANYDSTTKQITNNFAWADTTKTSKVTMLYYTTTNNSHNAIDVAYFAMCYSDTQLQMLTDADTDICVVTCA